MMRINKTIIALSGFLIIMGSCISNKKLAYLQSSDKTENISISKGGRQSTAPEAYRIMTFDNLFIRVVTPDPQWSAIFNIMPVGANGAVTEESAALFGYPVDVDGNIEIPFVGKIEAAGKTLAELKTILDSTFSSYVSDAAITVRLVNNYVSLLGEVNIPGRYPIPKDRLNVLEAISMAGDINEFGNRQKVQLVRPSGSGQVIVEFNLSDRSILNSELFYVLPNDIIYVSPVRGRSFRLNSPIWSLFLSTITSALGVIAFFRTI